MIEGCVAMSSLPMLCLDLKVLQLGMDAGPSTQEKKPDGKKKQKVEAPERRDGKSNCRFFDVDGTTFLP